MSPRIGRTGGSAARGFGRGTAVRGPRGIPSVVSATAVGTVENASNGKLNLTWTNADATAQTRIYNGGTLLATENAGTTTKSFTDLIANTAYTLTVKHYKDSIESAGANFSQATTYQYNGYQTTSYCGGGSGYELFYTYANGNNSTYDTSQEDWNIATCGYVIPTGTDTYSTANTYTWTVPGGVTSITVDLIGGGGGGGDNGSNYSGGGGGGGGHVTGTTSVTAGDVLTIVCPSGGGDSRHCLNGSTGCTGAAATITSAANGVLFTANGGSGGRRGSDNTFGTGGASGGAGATAGLQNTDYVYFSGGAGGSSYAAAGGRGGRYGYYCCNAGVAPGGGGGGAGGGRITSSAPSTAAGAAPGA